MGQPARSRVQVLTYLVINGSKVGQAFLPVAPLHKRRPL
jgi:hypothetical protein